MPLSRRNFLSSAAVSMAARTLSAALPTFAHRSQIERQREDGIVLLNHNENPYGPSLAVQSRLHKALADTNHYPASADILVARIAALHGIHSDRVVLGCGSTELIRAISALLLGPQKTAITAMPTYEAVSQHSRGFGARVLAVPLDHDFSHDLNAMLARVESSTALVYICNPNNPTGSITPSRSIEQFLAKLSAGIVVIVDEAYHDFVPRSSTYASLLDQQVAREGLVVLRTFSAAYALASLRVGYAVTSSELAARLQVQVTKMGVSELGLQGALAALDDDEGLRLSVKRNTDAKQEFFNQAMARMLKPIDSKTNFVMMDVRRAATEVVEDFRKNNVLIGRPFPPMNTHIRVSLGTPENMQAFWRVWDGLPYARGMKM